MSFLNQALLEIKCLKESLKLAAKHETDSYQLKKYTEWMGRCAFTEQYIKKEVEHVESIETIRTEKAVEHQSVDV